MEMIEFMYNWNSKISEGFHKVRNTSQVFQIIDISQCNTRDTKNATQKSSDNKTSYIKLNYQWTVIYYIRYCFWNGLAGGGRGTKNE